MVLCHPQQQRKNWASDAINHHGVGSVVSNEDNDKKNDDDDQLDGVMPNPYTLNDERSRCGFIHETSRPRDEEKK